MKLSAVLMNRTVKNAGYLIAGKVIQMMFGLVTGLLTARYLGPSNYGLIHYAGAYTGFFAALCTLGINNVLVKTFVDCPGEDGKVIGTALGLRTVSSILSAIAIILISSVFDADEPDTIAVVALVSAGMVLHGTETFNYWFQARLESKVSAAAALCAYLVSTAYKVCLLITGRGVALFALASSLDYLCLGIILYVQYRRRSGPKIQFSWEYAKKLIGQSRHFILSGLMISVYGQTDKLMLKQMMGEAEVGYYATAVALCGMWCFILNAIIDSAYPSIIRANRKGDAALFRRRNVQLYAAVFYLSVIVSLCLTVAAEPIICILYGRAYLPAAVPLRIITWYTGFSYLGVARNAWIVARERQRHLFRVYAFSAVANVALNLLLIPAMGASGAAAASLAAQVFTTLVVPFFIKDMRENSMLILEAIALKGILWHRLDTEER